MNTMHFTDTTGTLHTIGVEAATITLDGTPCHLVVKDSQVDLVSSDPTRAVITVAPASLWHTFAGSDPTPEAAGLYLAEALARHAALQEIAQRSQRVRLLLDEIDRHLHGLGDLALPVYHFDPFTMQLLRTYDGTPEHIAALATLLKQSPETICSWLAKAGLCAAPPHETRQAHQEQHTPAPDEQTGAEPMKIVPPTETVTGHDEQPMAPAPSDEIVTENQAGPAGDAKRGKRGFLWTEEHERLLAEAVRTRKPPSTNAKIKEIAARFDWPYHVVDYRMRQLHKKGENAPPVSEEPVLQEQTLTETEPVTSPLTIDVSPGPAPLTRSTEQVLQEPHQDEAQSVTSPLTDDVSPARLAPGPYLWDVKIDGNLQRWQLDAPYGNFPFASPGTPFVYREQAYVIQRVSHSVISVTPAVHAPRPAVMELAQV